MNKRQFYMAICVIATATGCGDRKIDTGIFLDAPVSNLRFKTNSIEGFTGAGGSFNYRTSERIEFFIGALSLGSTFVNDVITPIDLVVNGSIDEARVINRAILLQSLDQDSDLTNGIQIPREAHGQAPESLAFAQASETFIQDTDLLTFVRTATGDNQKALVTATAARDHLLESLNSFVAEENTTTLSAVASQNTGQPGQRIVLTGIPSDDIISYEWQQSVRNPFDVTLRLGSQAGVDDLTEFQADFVVPEVVEVSNFTFTFVGETADGQNQQATVNIRVEPQGIQPL